MILFLDKLEIASVSGGSCGDNNDGTGYFDISQNEVCTFSGGENIGRKVINKKDISHSISLTCGTDVIGEIREGNSASCPPWQTVKIKCLYSLCRGTII